MKTQKIGILSLMWFVFLFFGGGTMVSAQNNPKFIENKGQLPEQVAYKLRVGNADIFFEKDRLTFNFYAPHLIDQHLHEDVHTDFVGHAYTMHFVGADGAAAIRGAGNRYKDYTNYITQDHSVGHVPSFDKLEYTDVYQGIDLVYYGKDGELKYDIHVAAGTDPGIVQLKYEGADRVYLKNARLVVVNTFNTVEESIPLAYQIINGAKRTVDCEYALNGTTVSFRFPSGYNQEHDLIIDPLLIFSSYSGSTSDNFGFTATYDDAGALYAGGIAFSLGYPIVPGSYSSVFGGLVDIAISKFSANGANLIYSTYIGGTSTEAPHSMIINSLAELVILGSTSSQNYPTTVGAFDQTFNGGTPVDYTQNGANFENGSDMVITILSTDGSSLVGSTYLGGAQNDGLNESTLLAYNYGDIFRGEVIVDDADNIYITSSTQSANFPVTGGTFDQSLGGIQDACVARFNSDVSVLDWCTFLGGNGSDAGYSLKLNTTNEIYVAGGTVSQNFPIVGNTLNTSYLGGTADGFIVHLDNSATAIQSSSYIGTSDYDQAYFVEVDHDDDVYLYGQTIGNYPVTSGVYSNLNGRQFIQKLSPDLTTSQFSTVFGSGSAGVNISPTAFLVDICKRIYISGWGGETNNGWNAATGMTNGMATTANAEQLTTDGSDLYFMVLEADAANLLYGSYFGANGVFEHVDGGTSRFSSDGVIYQAVCAGCGGSSAFPTTPGVVSSANNSANCNLGVIKLDFEFPIVDVELNFDTTQVGCAPFEVQFNADILLAPEFIWYFGDGDSSLLPDPVHTFLVPGTYQVMLVGENTNCIGNQFIDTAFVTINVISDADSVSAGPDQQICPGESVQLNASGGATYSWTPAGSLSDPNIANPIAAPLIATEYIVTILTTEGCGGTDTVLVTIGISGLTVSSDTAICLNDSVQVFVNGGQTYQWTPPEGVSDPTSGSPYLSPEVNTVFSVAVTNEFGCDGQAEVAIEILTLPIADFEASFNPGCDKIFADFNNLSDNSNSSLWLFGDGVSSTETDPAHTYATDESIIITLYAYNNNSLCVDSITIDYSGTWLDNDTLEIHYPNVFTPNDDDFNDCFSPGFDERFSECYELFIYTRWGRLVFETILGQEHCWDGTNKAGGHVSEGTYYYISRVQDNERAGYVTVIY